MTPPSSIVREASYWQTLPALSVKGVDGPAVPPSADFVVVGGGLAGLSTARSILTQKPGASVVMLESAFVGYGASGRNGGLLSPLPAPVWLLSARRGNDMAWALKTLNARVHALGQTLQRLTPASEATETELHLQAMGPFGSAGLGQVARVLDDADIAHGVRDGRAGRRALALAAYVVNPFALVGALADDVRARGGVICEHAPVAGLAQNGAGARVHLLTGHAIDARCVVVCTNAYTKALGVPDGARKAKAVRNSMLATLPLDADLRARLGDGGRFVVELDANYVFYRLHQGRLIYGGIEGFSQTQGSDLGVPNKTLDALIGLLQRSLGGEAPAIAQAWSGLYHATITETPIIERHPRAPSIVMNVGYGGTGVALTQIFSELAASIATGQPLADPDAARLGRILQETRVPVRGMFAFGASVARQLLLGGGARPG